MIGNSGSNEPRLALDGAFGEVFNILLVDASCERRSSRLTVQIEHIARVGFAAWWGDATARILGGRPRLAWTDRHTTISASSPRSRKYSPIVQPDVGADVLHGGRLEAVAATTMVYSMAPACSSDAPAFLTEEAFLANRDINAGHVLTFWLMIASMATAVFAGLTVTDDQFALTATSLAPWSQLTSGRSASVG